MPANKQNQTSISSTSTAKYICGCGKTYTSYPAFSTHRKTKHDNINIQGTVLPKSTNTKRGRPSYQFNKNQKIMAPYRKYYQGLTVVELGVLNLNSKYDGKIISDVSQNMVCQFPQQFIQLCNVQKNSEKLVQLQKMQKQVFSLQKVDANNLFHIMLLFMELMITHLNRRPAQALIQFFSDFAIFASQNSNKNNQTSPVLQVSLFNKFFCLSEKKELIDQLSCDYGLKTQFFIDICVIFSEWMYKMDFIDNVLKIKEKSQSCSYIDRM